MNFVILSIVTAGILVDSYSLEKAQLPCFRQSLVGPLPMAKGFNKARNKQSELLKKMELAKQQNDQEEEGNEVLLAISGDDQDHQAFQKLLDSTRNALPTDEDVGDSSFIAAINAGQTKKKKKKKKMPPPPKKKQTKEETPKKGIAKRIHFESIIDIATGKELGVIGAAQLVPWVPPFLNDCLVVFADPRGSSGDLRKTIQYISSACSNVDEKEKEMVINQVICISADSASEIQSWLKRSKLSPAIRIFADPQLMWINEYTAISDDDGTKKENPWSMAMLVFDTNGEVCQRNQNINPSHATQLVLNAMNNLSSL